MSIKEKILKTKIQKLQLDPFGFCNAKCWFCPVRYIPQPESGSSQMPVELIEKIFEELESERKNPYGVVSSSFNFFTTAHYNEVLLYKNIKELFDLARKFKYQTYVLSNGISLSPSKIDLIAEYSDVVTHVGLNIPAFEKDLWAKRAGFSPDQFGRLMSNLEYASVKFKYLQSNFQIHINGLSKSMFDDGVISEGPEFESHDYDLLNEHENQYQLAKKLFPTIAIDKSAIFDRAGFIKNIVSNKTYMNSLITDKKVVGCTNSGDRVTDWLHVNSSGKVFLCCNDYNFDYEFGDLTKQSLSEIWRSQKHFDVIEKAFKEICVGCVSAKLAPIKEQVQPIIFSRKARM